MKIDSLKKFGNAVVHYNQLDFFPLRKNAKNYSGSDFKGDARAGFNVALLAFPQGMAYASIADIPIQLGIFGSAVAAIISSFFAGNRFITLGPTNATSVMLGISLSSLGLMTAMERASYLPILLLFIGLFLVIGAYFKLANLIQFISKTVVTGYITAAAIYIIANQLKHMLWIDLGPTSSFFDVLYQTLRHVPETQIPTLVLSVLTFAVYYLLQKRFKGLPNVAVTLIIMSFVAGLSGNFLGYEFALLESISISQWELTMPTLDLASISSVSTETLAPSTELAHTAAPDKNGIALTDIASVALPIALLCVLEGTSVGGSLAARSGSKLDGNQEMFSIGMANIGCGFLSGMPASGSLTRSVLAWKSGSASPLASLYNGIICVIALLALGPFIKYIPKASLAVLVITIGVSLINPKAIRTCIKATKSDAIVFITTMLAAFIFPLDQAIYIGVGLSVALFLRKAAIPELVEYGFTDAGELTELKQKEQKEKEVSIVHVEGNFFFGAAELFRDQMRRICQEPNLKIVILKMRYARYFDATGIMAMEELITYMNSHDRHLLVSECRPEHIKTFRESGLMDVIIERNVFEDDPQNPTLSTAKALRYAQKLIGQENAKISIYVKPKKQTDNGEENVPL